MVGDLTPLTEMLGLYRGLAARGQSGLTAHLALAEDWCENPRKLSVPFLLSVAQFSRYSNERQPFHEGPLAPERPETDAIRTADFADWLKKSETWPVAEAPELAFRYVDRELDCMRTSPGVDLEDGTPSKMALKLDLLLANAGDHTPIVAELKIHDDQDPLYGLVQALAATAVLVTAAQRTRLRNVYGLDAALRTGGPYVDVYVILFEPHAPGKGTWLKILERSLALADELLVQPEISALVRRIEFLHSERGPAGLTFRLATHLLQTNVAPTEGLDGNLGESGETLERREATQMTEHRFTKRFAYFRGQTAIADEHDAEAIDKLMTDNGLSWDELMEPGFVAIQWDDEGDQVSANIKEFMPPDTPENKAEREAARAAFEAEVAPKRVRWT